MTRKDYVAIAGAIMEVRRIEASTRVATQAAALSAIDATTLELAQTLRADNAAFDMGRFLAAAGYGTDGGAQTEVA